MSTPEHTPLTEAERDALGIRDADCGCCVIVDSTGLREVLAAATADTTATDAAASSGPLPEAVRRRVLNQRLGEHRERLRQHMSEQSVTIENESYGDGFANGLSQAIEWFCETLFNPATETYREPEPTTWGPALTALADQIADATRRAIDTGYGTDPRHGLLANAVADEVVRGKRFPIRLADQFGRASNEDEHCRRCGGDNFVWAAASPLWNFVMRGNNINGEPIFGDLVCMRCFIILAMMAGIRGRWRLTVDPEPEGLVYETPSGRRWDPERFLWVEAESKPSQTVGEAWAEHGHPEQPCQPPEAVWTTNDVQCRLTICPSCKGLAAESWFTCSECVDGLAARPPALPAALAPPSRIHFAHPTEHVPACIVADTCIPRPDEECAATDDVTRVTCTECLPLTPPMATRKFEVTADWRDRPHTHGGTDCGGGPDCPARA